MCFHDFRTDSLDMGDGWKCKKCGFSRYPEDILFKWFWVLLGRSKDSAYDFPGGS